MEIDLRRYVVAPQGEWAKSEDFFRADRLELRNPSDGVTLVGPLRVHVAVSALNELNVLGTSAAVVSARDAFTYVLDLAPGQTWTYGARTDPNDLRLASSMANMAIVTNVSRIGTNAGFGLVIRPAGPGLCAIDPCTPDPYRPADPCKSNDPCAPRGKSGCGCEKSPCACGGGSDALPCDFAVASHPDMGFYFPATCEPCTPGASIGMPPAFGAALVVPPAPGGTLRTRYFDGMSMAKEDFETDWKNARLKRTVSNRAIGQGVAWGFRVARDGSAVCITPGYGIDCCGNDVILSSPYRVESDALVRDPAARAIVQKRGPQRLHLLLEYFECPERPRPVHADACGRDAARCEMSRIRETARLRLVPPCDVDGSGPIQRFLEELAKLKNDPQLGPILATPAAVGSVESQFDKVPFQAGFELLDAQGKPYTPPQMVELQPAASAGTNARMRADVFPRRQDAVETYGRVRVRVRAASGFAFTSVPVVRVSHVDANGARVVENTPISVSANGAQPTELSWTEPVGNVLQVSNPATLEPIPPGLGFELRDWRMRDAGGNEYVAARTEIALSHLSGKDWVTTPWGKQHQDPTGLVPTTALHLQIPPSDVRQRTPGQGPRRYPCSSEACDPTGAPRFPALFPFMHPDPIRGDGLGDVRAIFLAILYAWLVSEQALADSSASDTAREQAARALYIAVWRSFYGTAPDTDRNQLSEALQRLFETWCCSLLYPGPTCRCEPHGVVVGCAVVEGGEIRSVDPWGGRRWVVLHPLLAHWGSQFGVMPLDAVASKLFDALCCIAHLPRPTTRGFDPQNPAVGSFLRTSAGTVASDSAAEPGRGAVVPFGGGALIFDAAGAAARRMVELKMVPSRTITLNPVDFVARVTAAMRVVPTTDATRPPVFVDYRVLGTDEIHLVALEDPSVLPQPTSAASGSGRLARVVQRAASEVSDVPPLLSDTVEYLAREILDRALGDARTLGDALKAQGADRIGPLLDRDPESLLHALGGNARALDFAEVLAKADRTARKVTRSIGEVVAAAWEQRTLVSRGDLADAGKAGKLAETLFKRLDGRQLGVSHEDVAAAIQRAARAGG